MTSAYQNIRQLYFENLTGTISEEDHIRLRELLETDENAQAVWRELEKETKALNMQRFVDEIEPERALEE